MIICCDIDGVLADVREYVLEYLLDGKKDWETYLEKTLEFPPVLPMVSLIRTLISNPLHSVYFTTGRPERNRLLTEEWIRRNLLIGFSSYYKLKMRPSRTQLTTEELKMGWYQELQPQLIIEDEPKIVKAATEAGFTVLQVHGFRVTENDMVPPQEV